MRYRHLQIRVYNEEPLEPNSFYVDCEIFEDHTFGQWMERIVKPAAACVFTKMIPEMPSPDTDGLGKFMAWDRKYYGEG